MNVSDRRIDLENFDDLIRAINLSSLLELSGWPKIGNVHRTKNFNNTTYEHFLAGIAAILPNFISLCRKAYNEVKSKQENLSFIRLGLFFKESSEEMMKWQSGGNVLLGHILILAPLASAAAICLKLGLVEVLDFKIMVKKVIDDATVEDTINLYRAMKTCKPGGLGVVEKYDISNDKSYSEIKDDNVTLLQIFQYSMHYDLISREYATGFSIIIDEGLPYLFETFERTKNINHAIVNTFLYILKNYPDTLIIRKLNKDSALYVSNLASKVLKHNGITTKKGLKIALKYDKKIQKEKGLLNPGTTADLVAGIIFCALIFGLKF